MTRRLAVPLAAVAAFLAVVPAAEGGSSRMLRVDGNPAEVTFANRNGNGTADQTILNQAIRLIDDAADGSEIAVTVFSIENNGPIEQALKRAAAPPRNVRVRIVYDKEDGALNEFSNLRVCRYACISDSTGDLAIMHTKMMLFSSTKRRGLTDPTQKVAAQNVSWISSANFNQNTGAEPTNNTITVYDAGTLYDELHEVWDRMVTGPKVADYFKAEQPANSGHGYIHASGVNAYGYVSPDQDGDLWYGRLRQVVPPPDGLPCTIRVLANHITDARLRDDRRDPIHELVSLHPACNVQVAVNRNDLGELEIQPDSLRLLRGDGIEVRAVNRVHDKVMLTDGSYGNSSDPTVRRPQVMTGSHNITLPALRSSDEIIVRFYDTPDLFNAYRAHFDEAWNRGDPLP